MARGDQGLGNNVSCLGRCERGGHCRQHLVAVRTQTRAAAQSTRATGRPDRAIGRSGRSLRSARFVTGTRLFSPGNDRCIRVADASAPSPGHVGLLFFTVAFLAWYAVNYSTATGPRPMPTETSPYPALFYGLLSLLLITYLLAGFAFFLDRYRIPVSLVILLGTLVLYGSFGTDHYYEPNPPREGLPATELATLTEVYDQWESTRRSRRASDAGRRRCLGRRDSGVGLDGAGPDRPPRMLRRFDVAIGGIDKRCFRRQCGHDVLSDSPRGRAGGVRWCRRTRGPDVPVD